MIRVSDDSSTESDGGLDSDFHSSPESLMDDDVVIVDAIGLPADDRGEGRGHPHALPPGPPPTSLLLRLRVRALGRAAGKGWWGLGRRFWTPGSAPLPRDPRHPQGPELGTGPWAGGLDSAP